MSPSGLYLAAVPAYVSSAEYRSVMTRLSRTSSLRQLQRNAENMARLSPFLADRERFSRIAERYREEADRMESKTKTPVGNTGD